MGVVTSCLDEAYGSGLPGDVQRITRYRRHSDMQPITRKKKRKITNAREENHFPPFLSVRRRLAKI